MQTVLRAGKHTNGAKRERTCKRRQARENAQTVPSVGEHANRATSGKSPNAAKRRKISKRCHAQEHKGRVSRAGRSTNGTTRGKTYKG